MSPDSTEQLVYLRYKCICIYGLFNYAVSGSGYIALNGRMTDKQWIGKDMEGSGRGFI